MNNLSSLIYPFLSPKCLEVTKNFLHWKSPVIPPHHISTKFRCLLFRRGHSQLQPLVIVSIIGSTLSDNLALGSPLDNPHRGNQPQ